MAEKITKKDLAGGEMLRELIKMFQASHTQVSLAGLLTCLRDSEVILPVKFGDEAKELPGGQSERSFKPCTVVADDGNKYMPIFSNAEQVDEAIKKNYTMAEMEFMECMTMAEKMTGVNGIIIDAYTKSFVLKNDTFKYVRNIPSRISK